MSTISLTMPHSLSNRQYYGDPALIIITGLLLTFGLVMMTSASIEIASRTYGDAFFFFKREAESLDLFGESLPGL